jgi:hypothetical protein
MVGLPLSEGPYLTEGAHTPKGHSFPGDLGLGAKDLSFLISMGRRDLSPSGSGLAWVLILPHLVLAQASMKESLVELPQSSLEMSLPHSHPVPIPSLPKSIHLFPSLTPGLLAQLWNNQTPHPVVPFSSHPLFLLEKVQRLARGPF